jgi:hypothetical protein
MDDSVDETFLTTSQELMRKMIQNHALDLKLTKQVPEFSDMEWNNVLLGKAINLDIIFTRMFSTATDS